MTPYRFLWIWLLASVLLYIQVQCFDEEAYEDDLEVVRDGNPECAVKIPRRKGKRKAEYIDEKKHSHQEICITYEAVNRAFKIAREHIPSIQDNDTQVTDVEIDNLGRIILETTTILTRWYRIHREDIYKYLPLIDTQKTVIDQYCPAYLKPTQCKPERYRQFDGLCNNLQNPYWGITFALTRRLLPPVYSDGLSKIRSSVAGQKLPSTRRVSTTVHQNLGLLSESLSVIFNAWGQAIAHDFTFTEGNPGQSFKCCDVPKEKRNPDCLPISIPIDDPFYSKFNVRCMEFSRSAVSLSDLCRLGPRGQLNSVTSFLDGSFIYGSSKAAADNVRAKSGGFLKSLSISDDLRELLPLSNASANIDDCLKIDSLRCSFVTGDTRVNQQPMIALISTIMMREHNRIASSLALINPHWDDEKLYQETRMIVSALVQHITYNEFLPIVLGKEVMEKFDLSIREKGYYEGYDSTIDPTISLEFSTGAYRFAHPLTAPTVQRWGLNNKFISAEQLRALLRKAKVLLKPGEFDLYTSGFLNQAAGAETGHETTELTEHLFETPGSSFGQDLASIDMQRGRDHGLPTYNDVREVCGLKRARVWNDLLGAFSNRTLGRYRAIYKSPDDIDLWSGGVSENRLPDGLVGPAFSCILGRTFNDMRRGDRFWFENPNWPSSFTLEQLKEIRKVKLSRIICDNSDNLKTIQENAFLLPNARTNPRISCKNSVLRSIDLFAWREQ